MCAENRAANQNREFARRNSLTDFLLTKFTKKANAKKGLFSKRLQIDLQSRAQYAFLEAWVSIAVNFVLAALKIVFGLLLDSISLLADAVHTASDVITSVVVLVGFRIAKAPADEKHPFGHGRVEFLSSLIIALLLILVGIEFGKSSYERFLNPTPVKGNIAVVIIMVVGAVIKEWMTRFALHLGKKSNIQALVGDAWHHRTDAIASLLVALAIFLSKYGYYWIDSVLGMGVSGLIVYTGIELGLSSSSSLIGEKASDQLIQTIEKTVLSCSGVKNLHRVLVHDYGSHKSVSLHILVDDDLSLVESHKIATEVEKAVKARIPGDIVVHVEPRELEENWNAEEK